MSESIALIDALNCADVGRDERLTVDAVTIDKASGVNTEQSRERGGVKVMIAVDGDFFNAAARAELDRIQDVDSVAALQLARRRIAAWRIADWQWGRRLGLVIDFDVEVTLALKEIAQAAIAFIEEIFVDATFFKDGDEMLDAIGSDHGTLDFDLDDRTAIGGEAVVHRFGGVVVFGGFELDVGFKPVLLLIIAEYAIEGAIDDVVIDVSADAQVCVAAEFVEVHASVAGDDDLSYARPRA